MVMALNGKLRELIDAFVAGDCRVPVYVGSGSFYFVPSEMTMGDFYIVCQIQYTTGGKILRGWACSCRAFRFDRSGEEKCKHIRQVEEGLVGAGGATEPWTPGRSTSSPTASKSKRAPTKPRTTPSSPSSAVANKKGSTGSSSKTKAPARTSSTPRPKSNSSV